MDFVKEFSNLFKIFNFATTIDHFTWRFVSTILWVCSLLMTYNQYAFYPISCYTSVGVNSGHGFQEYVQNSCYLSERYNKMLDDGALESFAHTNMYLPIVSIDSYYSNWHTMSSKIFLDIPMQPY